MNRHILFHEIATNADLSSMSSILRTTLARVIAATSALRGAWFSMSAGGPRALVALSASGAELAQPTRLASPENLQRALSQNRPYQGEYLASNMEKTRFAIVPVPIGKSVGGLLWLERRIGQATLSNSDCALVQEVLGDVQVLLNSSRDHEQQSNKLDTMKSKMAMKQLQMISEHSSMINLFTLIRKLANVPSMVLIHGESGTGKELVARSIYELGNYEGPFISMNCGAIEPNLLKSELFGYTKGSFTGAHRDRLGLFKKAEGGILFMDEIAEMPSDMQVSLLRTLENGEMMPVGADMPLQVNTRVVAATHRDLREMVREGSFRNDLYQRLKGITLDVPPLRRRREDIPLLCQHFRHKYNLRLGKDFKGFEPEALKLLREGEYRSGNVRELEHMIERAMVFEDATDTISAGHLLLEDDPPLEIALPDLHSTEGTFEGYMSRFAVQVINQAIEASSGNKTKAMKRLGLSRSTFYSMLSRYGVPIGGELE